MPVVPKSEGMIKPGMGRGRDGLNYAPRKGKLGNEVCEEDCESSQETSAVPTRRPNRRVSRLVK